MEESEMGMKFQDRTCLFLFLIWIFNGQVFAVVPMVYLKPRNFVNASDGGSLTITCEVETDVDIATVNFMKDSLVQVYIFPDCSFHSSDNKKEAYNVTCPKKRSFTVVKYNINTSEHGKSWMCQILANNGPCLTACLSNTVVVSVSVPLTSVQLTDDADQPLGTPIVVVEGFNKILRCNTSPNGSRPAAIFQWYMRHESQPYESIENQLIIHQPYTKQVPGQPNSDLLITYSTLIFTPQRSHTNMYLQCAAKDNTFNATLLGSQEVQIFVQYRPTVHLYPNNTIYNVTEGTMNLRLNCNVIDANPKPQLMDFIWLKDGNTISGQTSSSYIIHSVNRSDKGQYLCKANNGIGDGISNSLNIQVQYKPEIYPLEKTNVEEGQNIEVTCNVSAFPSPDVSWSSSARVISTSAALQMHSILRTHTGNYTCMAQNILHPTNMTPIINKVSDILRVDVLYGPGNSTSLSTNSSLYTMEEGSKALDIVCKATCNPNCSYYWHQDNKTITYTNTLVLGYVKRNNSGLYNCTAYNRFLGRTRESTVSLKVIIKYAPNVTIKLYGSAILNTSATLECTPQGEPSQYTFHEWIHMVGDTEIRRLTGTLTGNSSTITLSNISIQDLGLYTCTVENSVTNLNGHLKQTASTYVYIQGPPVFLETQYVFVGDASRSTRIEIPIYSNHSIKILKLIKHSDSSNIISTSETSNNISISNITITFYKKKAKVYGYTAFVIFYNLKDTDFDNYTLHVQNAAGNNSLEFSLIASGVPSTPKVFVLSHWDAGLPVFEFKEGFNGGHQQTFNFEYQRLGTPESNWTILMKISETSLKDRTENGTYLINIPYLPDGHYIFRVYAENEKGHSTTTENVTLQIRKERYADGNKNEVFVPAIVGSLVAVVLAVVAVVVFVVKHNKRDATEPEIHFNARNSYFENPDNAYENAFHFGMNGEEFPNENIYQNLPNGRSQQPLINNDGLIYADLELEPAVTSGGRSIIRGIENRTIYAEISFGKRDEPLTDRDDEKCKETNEIKN